jgi:hypothetical protein
MRKGHVDDGTLRAYLDGEHTVLAALRIRWHVQRCPACRHALSEQRALRAHSAALLALLPRSVDVEAGWRRVSALRGRTGHPRPTHRLAWSLGAAGLIVAAVAGVTRLAGWNGPGTDATRAIGGQVRDVCCFDLDAGGPGDDGVFTLSGREERVDCVLVYDDLDRSRALSSGDRMRYVSREAGCKRAITARVAMLTGGAMVASASPSRPYATRHAGGRQ